MERELRSITSGVEFRVEEQEGKSYIAGYAAVFRSMSVDLGGFLETIEPTAFLRALEEGQDVVALAEHDTRMILGRSSSGTLQLKSDQVGLHMRIEVPDTSVGRDYLELVKRGDINAASFAFTVADGGEHWTEATRSSPVIRTLSDLDLHDVSVVSNPAYKDTFVSARSLEACEDFKAKVEAEKAEARRSRAARARELRLRGAGS